MAYKIKKAPKKAPYGRGVALGPTSGVPLYDQVDDSKVPRDLMTGEESYKTWHERITTTLRWRKRHWNGDDVWRRAYKMHKGDHWGENDGLMGGISDSWISSSNPRQRATVNLTGSTIENLLPFFINGQIQFRVQARRPEGIRSAKLQQEALNYEWAQRDMNVQVERSVLDNLIIGHGVIKTGYNLEVDEAAAKRDGELNYSSFVKKDAPFIKRVDPFFFILDPSAPDHDLASARWCAEIFLKPLSDVVANARYSQSIRSKIRSGELTPQTIPTYRLDNPDGVAGQGDFPGIGMDNGLGGENLPEADTVVLYEVWDKKFKKYYVFCAGIIDPLIERDWPYDYLDGFPYEMVGYIDIPNEIYGVGLPAWIEDQQFELNRMRTTMMDHRRKHQAKYQVLEGKVDEAEIEKFRNGGDGTIVYVQEPGAIQPIPPAGLTSEPFNIEGVIRADIQELTGSDALISGQRLPSRTTAGEISARTKGFQLKLDNKVEAVERFVTKIGTQVLQHIKANFTGQMFVRIAGPEGREWIPITAQDIQDDVDVTVQAFSASKFDPEIERQQSIQLLQILPQALQVMAQVAPLAQQAGVSFNFQKFLKWVMEKFGTRDAAAFFEDAPAPQVTPGLAPPTPAPGIAAAPASPEPPNPSEGLSAQDIMQQLLGQIAP